MNITQRLSDDGLAIFLFHGVVEKSNETVRNYTKKHITKDYFYNIVRDLKRMGHPLSMDEVVAHHNECEPYPPYSFAITFDDGFENNHSVVAPILKDLWIPATFYVTTDFIENNHMSWIDRIEYCIDKCPNGKVRLPWVRDTRKFESPGEKTRLLEEIRAHVKKDPSVDIGPFVRGIFEQCGLEPVLQSDHPLDKKMNWDQVRELAGQTGFLVGGHTHTHAIMSFLSHDELEWEVTTSLNLLQECAGVRTRHYSYPEGLAHSYSREAVNLLKQHGIICSPTAIDGVNSVHDDLFHIKRVAVV